MDRRQPPIRHGSVHVYAQVNDLGSLWDIETARGNEGSAVTDAGQQLLKEGKEGRNKSEYKRRSGKRKC